MTRPGIEPRSPGPLANTLTIMPNLNTPNRGKTTVKKEIANQIAAEFSLNSSSNHYSPKFQKYENNVEKKKLNFTSDNKENYNSSFSITELKNSINKGKKTATDPDEIPYQLLKHLLETSLTNLL